MMKCGKKFIDTEGKIKNTVKPPCATTSRKATSCPTYTQGVPCRHYMSLQLVTWYVPTFILCPVIFLNNKLFWWKYACK